MSKESSLSLEGFYQHKVQQEPSCDCRAYNFEEWLPHIAKDFFWFNIHTVGSYQGQVFGVALYKNQIAIYEDYYGSCSGCGAWGEGGEPTSQDEVVSRCKLFDSVVDAVTYLAKIDSYERPEVDSMVEAIKKAEAYRTKVTNGISEDKT